MVSLISFNAAQTQPLTDEEHGRINGIYSQWCDQMRKASSDLDEQLRAGIGKKGVVSKTYAIPSGGDFCALFDRYFGITPASLEQPQNVLTAWRDSRQAQLGKANQMLSHKDAQRRMASALAPRVAYLDHLFPKEGIVEKVFATLSATSGESSACHTVYFSILINCMKTLPSCSPDPSLSQAPTPRGTQEGEAATAAMEAALNEALSEIKRESLPPPMPQQDRGFTDDDWIQRFTQSQREKQTDRAQNDLPRTLPLSQNAGGSGGGGDAVSPDLSFDSWAWVNSTDPDDEEEALRRAIAASLADLPNARNEGGGGADANPDDGEEALRQAIEASLADLSFPPSAGNEGGGGADASPD